MFRHKSTSDIPPPLYPRPTVRQRILSEGCQSETASEEKMTNAKDRNQKKPISKLQHSASVDSAPKQSETKAVTRSHSNVSEARKMPETPDFYLTPTEDSGGEIYQYYEEEEDLNQEENQSQRGLIARRPPMPLPEPPEETQEGSEPTSSDNESHDYDYPEGEEIRKLKKPYVGIDVLEAERVSLEGQTAESFYAYSIDEVVRCFKMVGLPDMAEKCEKEKINGKFFEGLSKEEIKMYFELDPLHFLKVKKAIFDGWRPR